MAGIDRITPARLPSPLNPGATLDHLREAVTTLEEIGPTARRVLGGMHPLTSSMETELRKAQAALRARETKPPAGGA